MTGSAKPVNLLAEKWWVSLRSTHPTIWFTRPALRNRHCEPTGPRKARPDDRLSEAIQNLDAEKAWIASALKRLAMTGRQSS
jgi:hypothetical protein